MIEGTSVMSKKSLLLCGVFIAVALPAWAVSEHNNEVFFAINGISAFQFTETAHSVTKKQPYSGTTSDVSNPGAEARIVVKAGRKKSTDVAKWFKTQVGSGQTLVCDSKGNFPDELNFAVQGTLKMTIGDKKITCQNILVGQGHFGLNNNWWMGGPNMQGAHVSLSGATVQTCSVEGKALPVEVVFSPQTPCVNHFNISVMELK
jgi:hypothetical protein